jgi:uncharacterized protein with WD repeat
MADNKNKGCEIFNRKGEFICICKRTVANCPRCKYKPFNIKGVKPCRT